MSDWGRYVPVAERRAKARRKAARLKKAGHALKPVEITGRTIARTFWGRAWCKNLEAYSDYANRLPRGRTYARNGSVLDLQIAEGRIDALVSGTRLYKVGIRIDPLPEERWLAIRGECAGQIDSLVELLQGKLSRGVMDVVTRQRLGLFPSPREIHLACSCPDWAEMCKHVAASLYGVGARLDHEPEMLFALRAVAPSDMIEEAIDRGVTSRKKARGRTLEADDLSAVFGVDIDFDEEDPLSDARPKRPRRKPEVPKKPATKRRRAKPATRHVATALTDEAHHVLGFINEDPGLRTPQIAEQLGMPRPIVTRAIALLKRRGLLVFVGAPRNGGYYAVDNR